MKSKFFIVVSFAVLMFTGCCSTCQQRAKNQLPLYKTEWHLVQAEGKDLDLKEDSFNIIFNEHGYLAGVAACNRLLGRFEIDESKSLRFVNVGSTMMLCPENDELERKFMEILNVVTHYDIDGDVLMLLSDGSIKALLKGKAQLCEKQCEKQCDKECNHDCKKGECKGECDHNCDKAEGCKKECKKECVKECHKGDCTKKAECAKKCEKAANCTKKAECEKKCEKAAECTKKAECKKSACQKGDCTKKAECKKEC